MRTTLSDLIAAISARFGYYTSGTASGGTTTTLSDSGLIEPGEFWKNLYCRLLTGANAGAERIVTGYTRGTGITLAPDLPSPVASGDTYELKPVRTSDAKRAINEAIGSTGTDWMRVLTDETALQLAPGQQMYDLSAALPDLVDVMSIDVFTTVRSDGTGNWQPWTAYEVEGPVGSRQLLARNWSKIPNVGALPGVLYKLRITYLALVPTLDADSDTLELNAHAERDAADFIEEYALHILHEQAWARNPSGELARAHFQMKNDHLAKAMQISQQHFEFRPHRRITRPARPRQI